MGNETTSAVAAPNPNGAQPAAQGVDVEGLRKAEADAKKARDDFQKEHPYINNEGEAVGGVDPKFRAEYDKLATAYNTAKKARSDAGIRGTGMQEFAQGAGAIGKGMANLGAGMAKAGAGAAVGMAEAGKAVAPAIQNLKGPSTVDSILANRTAESREHAAATADRQQNALTQSQRNTQTIAGERTATGANAAAQAAQAQLGGAAGAGAAAAAGAEAAAKQVATQASGDLDYAQRYKADQEQKATDRLRNVDAARAAATDNALGQEAEKKKVADTTERNEESAELSQGGEQPAAPAEPAPATPEQPKKLPQEEADKIYLALAKGTTAPNLDTLAKYLGPDIVKQLQTATAQENGKPQPRNSWYPKVEGLLGIGYTGGRPALDMAQPVGSDRRYKNIVSAVARRFN